MNALSLFSGIGGLDIASERAGFKTVAFCEKDKFCQKVLAKNWPGIRIFDDIQTIKINELPPIELVHGGYPCQPFSTAGKRRGKKDERHLWPAMFAVIKATQPTWVVAENVKGHITLGLDDVLRDLEGAGYTARPFVIPACAVGASHTRERVFTVAHSTSNGRYDGSWSTSNGKTDADAAQRSDEVSDIKRRRRLRVKLDWESYEAWGRGIESGVRRTTDGIQNRVDRIRSLGNAVVPQQAYPIFLAIAETYSIKFIRQNSIC